MRYRTFPMTEYYMAQWSSALDELGELGGLFKKIKDKLKKVGDKIESGLKNIGNKVASTVGMGEQGRDVIDRQVYGQIFGGVWGQVGPQLIGIIDALKGGMGQLQEIALGLTSMLSGKFADKRAKTANDRAQNDIASLETELGPVIENAMAYLSKRGVSPVAASPERAEEYASQFAEQEKTDRRGRYYYALRGALTEIRDRLETLGMAKDMVKTAQNLETNIVSSLPPQVSSYLEQSGIDPKVWSDIAAKAGLNMPLTKEEQSIFAKAGEAPKAEAEKAGWVALLPLAAGALLLL